MKKATTLLLSLSMLASLAGCASEKETSTTYTGEADGYGGKIQATVTVTGDKITAVELKGDGETPAIGGAALEPLAKAIVDAGTIEGVDGVSGATWTSKGVIAAVKNALGIEEETAGTDGGNTVINAKGLKQGIGHVSTYRLGPGKDEAGNPVYSFNEVFAYVITDADGRIVDVTCDIVEIITPNHDGQHDNFIAGWPGQTYAYDEAHDGKTITELTETEETWTAEISGFQSKRELGDNYKMNSGTWTQEMSIYENWMVGKTAEELKTAEAELFSDLNGRPLNANVSKDEDVAKRGKLNDAQLAEIDTLAGATMSVNDAHGDLITAVVNAVNNAEAITSDAEIAKTGLGIDVVYRLGPGKDEEGNPVYSFNITAAGTAVDAEGKIVETTVDILEIITPNHDGEHDNRFTGWVGSEYAADLDADGSSETTLVQTEETFIEQISSYQTKRALGDNYKMNSGTWTQEMNIYETWFQGQTAAEIQDKYALYFSDLNGRPLNANVSKDEDIAKRAKLNDAQLAEIDTMAGATMSITDAHGNILNAVMESIANAE